MLRNTSRAGERARQVSFTNAFLQALLPPTSQPDASMDASGTEQIGVTFLDLPSPSAEGLDGHHTPPVRENCVKTRVNPFLPPSQNGATGSWNPFHSISQVEEELKTQPSAQEPFSSHGRGTPSSSTPGVPPVPQVRVTSAREGVDAKGLGPASNPNSDTLHTPSDVFQTTPSDSTLDTFCTPADPFKTPESKMLPVPFNQDLPTNRNSASCQKTPLDMIRALAEKRKSDLGTSPDVFEATPSSTLDIFQIPDPFQALRPNGAPAPGAFDPFQPTGSAFHSTPVDNSHKAADPFSATPGAGSSDNDFESFLRTRTGADRGIQQATPSGAMDTGHMFQALALSDLPASNSPKSSRLAPEKTPARIPPKPAPRSKLSKANSPANREEETSRLSSGSLHAPNTISPQDASRGAPVPVLQISNEGDQSAKDVFEDILFIGQEKCVEDWPENSPELLPDWKPAGTLKLRRESIREADLKKQEKLGRRGKKVKMSFLSRRGSKSKLKDIQTDDDDRIMQRRGSKEKQFAGLEQGDASTPQASKEGFSGMTNAVLSSPSEERRRLDSKTVTSSTSEEHNRLENRKSKKSTFKVPLVRRRDSNVKPAEDGLEKELTLRRKSKEDHLDEVDSWLPNSRLEDQNELEKLEKNKSRTSAITVEQNQKPEQTKPRKAKFLVPVVRRRDSRDKPLEERFRKESTLRRRSKGDDLDDTLAPNTFEGTKKGTWMLKSGLDEDPWELERKGEGKGPGHHVDVPWEPMRRTSDSMIEVKGAHGYTPNEAVRLTKEEVVPQRASDQNLQKHVPCRPSLEMDYEQSCHRQPSKWDLIEDDLFFQKGGEASGMNGWNESTDKTKMQYLNTNPFLDTRPAWVSESCLKEGPSREDFVREDLPQKHLSPPDEDTDKNNNGLEEDRQQRKGEKMGVARVPRRASPQRGKGQFEENPPGATSSNYFMSEAAQAEWASSQKDLRHCAVGEEEDERLEGVAEEEEGDTDSLMEWWNTVELWDELPSDEEVSMKEDETKSFTQIAEKVHRGLRIFNKVFVERGEVLYEHVIILHAIADDLNNFHKRAKIGGITGGTTAAVGGAAAIAGLALAPVTFGASLIVSAVGLGVATAGGITSASAAISDRVNNLHDRKKIEVVAEDYRERLTDVTRCLHFASEGLRRLRRHPLLRRNNYYAGDWEVRRALQMVTLASEPVERAKLLTANAVATLAGLFKGMDKYFTQDSRQELRKGCKKEATAKVRAVAQQLHEGLVELNRVREELLDATGNM